MPAGTFWGDFLKMTFSHFRSSNGKLSAFWLNFSVRFVKLAFYFSIGPDWGLLALFKTLFLEYFYLSKEKFLHIWQNFSGRLIKLHSKSSMEQFAGNHKFPKLFPNSSITFDCSVELFTPFDKSIRFDRPKRLYVFRGLLCRKTCLCERKTFFSILFESWKKYSDFLSWTIFRRVINTAF